jgi:hypothetical protein
MTFTLRQSSSAVAAPARTSVPAADPWDAPYFGGRVYFSYHPTLYPTLDTSPAPALPSAAIAATSSTAPTLPEQAQAQASSRTPSPLSLDPWDAPYFGGPVYFRYPAFPVAVAALAAPAAQLDAMPDAPSGIPTPTPSSPSALPDPPAIQETRGPLAATPATPAAPVTASTPAPTPPRRGWLARLFRAG